MKTTIRIPDALAAEAQQRADWLGLSFNSLVAVALDAYLGHDRSRASVPEVESPEGLVPGLDAPAPALSRQQRRAIERRARKDVNKGEAA